jgi:chemotaxis protein methyltransferase CheR
MRIEIAPPPPMAHKREFDYGSGDFERVRKLIYHHAGIALNESKVEMVYSRIAKRLRTLHMNSFKPYLDMLEDDAHPEWEHFVNALTTNLTEFFREPHHYPVLADLALRTKHRPFRVWSAACSTGEEPYSLAMTLCDAFDTVAPPVTILATDLDTGVLSKAREGIYSEERISDLDMEHLRRYFLRGKGGKEGMVRMRSEIRSLITFHQLNFLAPDWDVRGPFEAIFCRNVLIYFDKPTQYQVLKRLAERMAPGGLLFAGHSESLLYAADLFQPIGKTVYRLTRDKGTQVLHG